MRLFICLTLLLAAAALPAAESPAPQPVAPAAPAVAPLFSDREWAAGERAVQPAAGPAAGTGTVATLGVGLLLVVGMAVGLGWLLKRLNARRLLGGRGKNLELLESISVGPRRQVALVRCGGSWLVVGLGEREMIAIATLPAPVEAAAAEAAATAAPAAAPAKPTASPFAAELSRLLGGSRS